MTDLGGRQLDLEVRRLLDDEQYRDHPLRAALGALVARSQQQVEQLEQLTHQTGGTGTGTGAGPDDAGAGSDTYHAALRYQKFTLGERYQRQLRQLRKIVRISDQYQHMMHDLNQALQIASTHDPLTGLPNRRLMMERLEGEVARVGRGLPAFSVLMLDLDHFKRVNDTYGHDVGDAVLRATSSLLGSQGRSYDSYGRWGGEEFLGLLPATNGAGAQVVAQRLCAQLGRLEVAPLSPGHLTVSIGLAEHRLGDPLATTLKRADEALYLAKHDGRNTIRQAS